MTSPSDWRRSRAKSVDLHYTKVSELLRDWTLLVGRPVWFIFTCDLQRIKIAIKPDLTWEITEIQTIYAAWTDVLAPSTRDATVEKFVTMMSRHKEIQESLVRLGVEL